MSNAILTAIEEKINRLPPEGCNAILIGAAQRMALRRAMRDLLKHEIDFTPGTKFKGLHVIAVDQDSFLAAAYVHEI